METPFVIKIARPAKKTQVPLATKTTAMDVGHHKLPVCSLSRNLFSPQTVTLRGIIEVVMRRVFQVA
jgi:hypothetical protein